MMNNKHLQVMLRLAKFFLLLLHLLVLILQLYSRAYVCRAAFVLRGYHRRRGRRGCVVIVPDLHPVGPQHRERKERNFQSSEDCHKGGCAVPGGVAQPEQQ